MPDDGTVRKVEKEHDALLILLGTGKLSVHRWSRTSNPLLRAIIQVAFAAPAKFVLLPTTTATIRTKYRTAAFGDMLGTLCFPSPQVVGCGSSAAVASTIAAREAQRERGNSCRKIGGN
jgi:hypothetical protein